MEIINLKEIWENMDNADATVTDPVSIRDGYNADSGWDDDWDDDCCCCAGGFSK